MFYRKKGSGSCPDFRKSGSLVVPALVKLRNLLMFYVYIIQSRKTGSYYVGSCSKLDLRLERHNLGWSKSTKNKRPWSLRYKEVFGSKKEALKREKEIKRQKSRIYIEKLLSKSNSGSCPDFLNRKVSSSPLEFSMSCKDSDKTNSGFMPNLCWEPVHSLVTIILLS